MNKGWKCNNCGHIHEASENLGELGFKFIDQVTTKTSCQNCGSYTLQRAYTYDQYGRPVAGHFLMVKAKIKRGN